MIKSNGRSQNGVLIETNVTLPSNIYLNNDYDSLESDNKGSEKQVSDTRRMLTWITSDLHRLPLTSIQQQASFRLQQIQLCALDAGLQAEEAKFSSDVVLSNILYPTKRHRNTACFKVVADHRGYVPGTIVVVFYYLLAIH